MTRSSVDLEWIILDDDKDWPQPKAPPPRWWWRRWRAILIATLVSLALALTPALILRYCITQNQRRLKADLQVLIDLEAQAIADGDRELFLSLKSREDAAWFEGQESTFDYYVQNPDNRPHLQVTDVELVDDYAWVHTTGTSGERGERFEWVLFYRWIKDTWRHATPDVRYWGPEQEQNIGPLHFVCHERDEPYIEPIAADLTALLTSLCDDLGCPAGLRLTAQLTLPYPHGRSGATAPDVIVIPSPAAQPQPTDAPLTIPFISFQSSRLAHYLAFEAAGGKRRWESNPYGAWLVHAAANWAQERSEYGTERPSWRLHTGQGQELLRMVVRNGHAPSLDDLWHNHYFRSFSYPTMIQHASRYIDLDSAKARAVIDYVVEIYGKETVPELLRAMGRHDTLEATLQEALGVGLGGFEPTWLVWLETHYGFGKGWRLVEAVAYWEETYGRPFASLPGNDVHYRQYRELMRTAVRGDRVLPLAELWNRGYGAYVTTGVTRITTQDNRITFLQTLGYEFTEIKTQDDRTLLLTVDTATGYSLVKIGSPAEQPTLPGGVFATGVGESSPDIPTSVGRPSTWRSAHALAVIRYIAEAHGKEAVRDLPLAIVRNDTLDGALRDVLGVGLDEFEPAWRAWLRAHYGGEQVE